MGKLVIKEAQILTDFVKRNNPEFDGDIAGAFLKLGEFYGIRGDVAFCQSIIETGWFKFADGTAVKPEQHNYCGMGVLERGMEGNSFDTITMGVEAQLQHLFAYASKGNFTNRPIVDPRFDYVERGISPTWEGLGGKWSSQKDYGDAIMRMYADLYSFALTHYLFKPESKEMATLAKPIVQVKTCEGDAEANDFLASIGTENVVGITPLLYSQHGYVKHVITYKTTK